MQFNFQHPYTPTFQRGPLPREITQLPIQLDHQFSRMRKLALKALLRVAQMGDWRVLVEFL